jgi:peptidoglycan/xylan/chitin deacetylase (PgdA/CDA1 family)
VVLAYHHVGVPVADPFEIAVPPDQFADQMRALSAMGAVLTVSELSERIRSRKLPDVCFAVTFDDGYANNLHTAKPILERYGVPATVFVTTGFVGGVPFWWDQMNHLIFSDRNLGKQLTLELGCGSGSWLLDPASLPQVHRELRELLRSLDHDHRMETLAEVRSQLDCDVVPAERSLTAEEIAELAKDGLVAVGAHTCTHPVLPRLTDEAACEEIWASKAWLEAELERPVSAFAYPYGEHGLRDVELVRRARFEIAFTTVAEAVSADCNPLQVPRLSIGRWDGAELERAVGRLLET